MLDLIFFVFESSALISFWIFKISHPTWCYFRYYSNFNVRSNTFCLWIFCSNKLLDIFLKNKKNKKLLDI